MSASHAADTAASAAPRPLRELLVSAGGMDVPPDAGGRVARGVTARSDDVAEGFVFVAVPGARVDGHAFVGEAVRRGACAVVVEREPAADPGVPVIRVDGARRALALLAAAWHGHPARRLSLAGVTGTVGKTSVLSILEAVLLRAGRRVATVGSLGLRVDGEAVEETPYTAPDPVLLHRELERIVEAGAGMVAMEVTSHALDQERVAGLRYDLGVFTNLIPLEHSDYHGTFRDYVDVKSRFLDHLGPQAPLVYSVDDLAVRRLVGACDGRPVGCGRAGAAMVRVRPGTVSPSGTRVSLEVRRPLPLVGGGEADPGPLSLELRLLGRANVSNAALAATAALCLGAGPEAVRAALAAFPPPPRRVEVIHRGRFTVIDDTVGHPESVGALFEVVERLRPRRVHLAFAVRGSRGARVNRENARALAVWAGRLPVETVAVTPAVEAADERNRVSGEELAAFLEPLRADGIEPAEHERLEDAVAGALEAAGEGDVVLLMGAQAMDRGAALARAWLRERGETGG